MNEDMYEEIIGNNHRMLHHKHHPNLYIIVSGNDDDDISFKQIEEFNNFTKYIIEEDKKKNITRDKEAKEILANECTDEDEDHIDEFDDTSISDIKKEFYDKYGMDITEEFYAEELKTAEDIKYHGKYKGYKMFTYINTYNDTLLAVNHILGLTIPESCIGHKKDVDLIVEELKYLIDDTVYSIREKGTGYWSPFLKKDIKV